MVCEPATAVAKAICKAEAKANRMRLSGRPLSESDRRVLIIGQFLAEASPGDLKEALKSNIAKLEQAVIDGPATYEEPVEAVRDQPTEAQLALLEQHGTYSARAT